MPQPAIFQRLQNRAPLLACALLALLALLMLASLAWQVLDWLRLLRSPPASAANAPAVATAAPSLERLDNLFGIPPGGEDGAPPATNLQLTLAGSFVNADPARSSAIIKSEGGPPEHYVVGSEISEGIRLHSVYRDHIEIDRNGRLESLGFPTQRAAPEPDNEEYAPDDDQAEKINQLQEENATLLQERLDSLRDKAESAEEQPEAPAEDNGNSDDSEDADTPKESD